MSHLDWAFLIMGVLSFGFFGWFLIKSILSRFTRSLPTGRASALSIKMSSSNKILAVGLLGLLISVLLELSSGFVLSLGVLCFWFVSSKGPSWKRAYEARRRLEKARDLFPQAVGMAVQGLKAGQTMPQVLEYLSRECPEPLAGEFALALAEMDLGASAEAALSKMSDRFGSFPEFQQFLESYRVSRQTGASLTRLLEVLLEGLEEKNRLLRKMDSMTAQARLSGLMMGLLPFLLALVFFFMDPDLLTPLFTQKTGWAILGLAFFLETIGFLWIRQLLRLEA